MEWISIKDRLPKDSNPVLIFCKEASEARENYIYTYIYIGECVGSTSENEYVWIIDGDEHEDSELIVTHWMPLPHKPKETHD